MDITNPFKDKILENKTKKIRGERELVISDILDLYHSVPFKRKQTFRNFAVLTSQYSISDLYTLLSKMKQAKNPAALFWWHVKK